MHDFIEKLKEALSHTTIESIFGHPIAEAIGGFAGSVAANIAASFILSGIVVAAAWFAWFELPGRLKAWAIRRGDRNRLNILLARFGGEGSLDIKDRVKEQLNKVFGEIADRPFEVIDFPVTLREAQAGNEKEIEARVVRK
jgi:ribosomal protein S5